MIKYLSQVNVAVLIVTVGVPQEEHDAAGSIAG